MIYVNVNVIYIQGFAYTFIGVSKSVINMYIYVVACVNFSTTSQVDFNDVSFSCEW